ncbi:YIP1 family protein [bacterium]|nr:YIP1 family protein [bacterium]
MTDDIPDEGAGFPPAPDPYRVGDGGPPPQTPRENLPPWEDRAHFTVVAGFLNTIPQVMTAPGRFFTDHPVRRGLLGPVTFGVLIGVISAIAEWVWSHIFTGFEQNLLGLLGEDYEISGAEAWISEFAEGFGVLVSPVLALIAVFLVAGLVHLGVMLAAADRNRGFEATLRATAYAGGATILALIPICGDGIGSIWALVVAVIGVRTMHGIGTGPALLAVLAPLLLCCCGCVGLIALIAGLAAS